MLVVDINTLQTVYFLYLADDVILNGFLALYCQNVGRVDRALGKSVARLNTVAVRHLGSVTEWYRIGFFGAVVGGYHRVTRFLYFLELYRSRNFGDYCRVLRVAALEQFLNTRQTLCDVLRVRDTARVEVTHCKLCAGFADRLRRDRSDRLAAVYQLTVRQRHSVALRANTVPQFARQNGTNFNSFNAGLDNLFRVRIGKQLIPAYSERAVGRCEILGEEASHKTFLKLLHKLVALAYLVYLDTVGRAAVVAADNDLLRNIDKSSGKITGVRGTKRGIRQALTSASRGYEVFQYVQALTIVCSDRHFDSLARGVRDKSAHTRKLSYLRRRTTRAGIRHHKDVVVLIEVCGKRVGNVIRRLVPYLNELLLTFCVGDKSAAELLVDLGDRVVRFGKYLSFLRRYLRIADRYRDTRSCGVLVAHRLYLIEHLRGGCRAVYLKAAVDNLTELLLAYLEAYLIIELVIGIGSVHISQVLRDMLVEYDTPRSCGHYS